MPAATWPVPTGVPRVLLFGGTFDPVHLAHVRCALAARDRAIGTDAWLVFVPARQNPLKGRGPVAPDRDRVEMLRVALRGAERTAIWTAELHRPPPSYWVDTLREARAAAGPGADLRFLIGPEQAAEFRRWRDWRGVLALARPVVMARPPVETPEQFARALAAAGAWTGEESRAWRGWFVEGVVLDISATRLRGALESGDPRAAEWLDPEVLGYIRRRGLYPRGGGT